MRIGLRDSGAACGPQAKFAVRKDPFGLRYRSPVLSPFGLSFLPRSS
jgi:hypothetical protein